MSWGKPRKGGWSATGAEEPVTRFTQIIRSIVQVMPGGVIRYGKTGPDDDAHTGFWLGVTTDGVARFSVGGPGFWLKWDGSAVQICGYIVIPANPDNNTWLSWRGDDGEPCGYVHSWDSGSWHMMELGLPIPHHPDGWGVIDVFADGDFGKSLRLRLITKRGQPAEEQKMTLLIGNMESFYVDGNRNAWLDGRFAAAAAVNAGELVNLGQADARYVAKSAGWSGSFRTDEAAGIAGAATVTVVNGQITAVA